MKIRSPKIYFFSTVIISLLLIMKGAVTTVRAVEPPVIKDSSFQARFVGQSIKDPLRMLAGSTTTVTVTFRNTGKSAWVTRGLGRVAIFTFDPKYHPSDFAFTSWINTFTPTYLAAPTKPGQEGTFTFTLRAPQKPGMYRESFYLAAENKTWIQKGYFYLDLQVTAGPEEESSATPTPILQNVSSTLEDRGLGSVVTSASSSGLAIPTAEPSTSTENLPRALINEPLIRVGLLNTTSSLRVFVPFPFQLFAGRDFQSQLAASTTVSLAYQDGYYTATFDGNVLTSAQPLRLTPVQPNDYFILPDNERRISGRKFPFNAYRGTLEFHYSPKSSVSAVINELPLDWYIAGITETSDGAPYQYIKALLVAARSYAYYELEHTKPKDSLFDVYASTNDQLYLGYDAELSMPHVAQAERETYGEMVTYQGTPVITPYSSRTNGMTRTWKQAWGGTDKAWLQPVEAKYDQGMSRLGHGVGMSNHDAVLRAQKDGWDYKTIDGYYYTGTKIEKIY